MTNYEIIKKYLEHGFWAVCKTEKGYNIFSSICEAGIRSSDGWDKLGHAENYVGNICLEQEDIDNIKFSSITPMYPPFTLYKVGDLVDVLETASNLPGFDKWDDHTKTFVGIKGVTINDITSSGYILSMNAYDVNDKYGTYTVGFISGKKFSFPHHCLVPHIPTTPTDTITIGGLQYNVKEVEDRLKDIFKDLKPITK